MRANVLVAARSEAPIDLTVFAVSRSGSYATVLIIVLSEATRSNHWRRFYLVPMRKPKVLGIAAPTR